MAFFKKAKDIKVALVGYGSMFGMGQIHLEEVQRAGMTPVAVADLDGERLEAARRDFPGIATYPSIAALLKKSSADLVILVTPHNAHAKHVLQCLRAGRHVVVEKPMALTTRECDVMIREAKKRKRLLSTYHNRHWDGCIRHAVRKVRAGALGDVVRVEVHFGQRQAAESWWRSSRSISGGILYDWGVHLMEYALQIIDSDMVEVSGFLKSGYWAKRRSPWKKDTIEDEGTVVVRFANGIWLTVHMTQLDPSPDRKWFEIIGTEGTYSFTLEQWWLVQEKKSDVVTTQGVNPPCEGWRYYRNLVDHLTRGKSLVITPEWARRPIHLIDLACRSARQGRALKAKYK